MEPEDKEQVQSLYDLEEAEKAGGLTLIRALVCRSQYRLSGKVELLIAEGYFDVEDIEACIQTGSVRKTERDELACCIGNKKYEIQGCDTQGHLFYTVGKIITSSDGKLYFVITAHEWENNYV